MIDKIIKIKTIYNINHLINHFHLSKKNIKNLLEENIPINVLNLNIIESQTEKQINEAIDIWSLGCIFAEMIIKKPIFLSIQFIKVKMIMIN